MMYALNKFLLFHVLTCLGQNALGSKIINGELAQENSLQYMASVQDSRGHVCGGFLVNEDFVITAAHCDNHYVNPTTVVLGSHNLKKTNRTVRAIAKKCKHPFYIHVAYGNDIMLLKLSSKVPLGKDVFPIQLPYSEMDIKENQKCQVAGWGKTTTRGWSVDDLREVDVSVINPEVCREVWSFLPRNVICAGGYRTTKGMCQGDSGGPLVCNGVAVGIVSFNKRANCDYPDAPNVYTDITKHLPWINKILKEKDCEI